MLNMAGATAGTWPRAHELKLKQQSPEDVTQSPQTHGSTQPSLTKLMIILAYNVQEFTCVILFHTSEL
jgi:hypothetical protein